MATNADCKVIVLGSVNTDMVVRGPRLPQPGETVLGGSFFQAAGGKGANQAVAAARLAATPVLFIAKVGDDALGAESLAGLRRENLITDHVLPVPGQSNGVALILVDERGENCISVAAGANAWLRPADVDAVSEDLFRFARVFLASLESPLDAVVHALRRARRAGLLTILNPAPVDPAIVTPDLMSLVDVLTPNEGEAAALAAALGDAGAVAGRPSAETAARRLQGLGCASVVATMGASGCLVVESNVVHVPGVPVRAVDATAAGDAFNGALAVALAEGSSLVEAARWANRAASIAVTRMGAQPSLVRRFELDATAAR
jgi:ribokinase